MTPLLALGPHVFEIAPLNFQEIERQTEAHWPAIARFGNRPGRQFTGYGEDMIRIYGLLYPDELGGREEFEAIRTTQAAARPVLMIGWSVSSSTKAKVFGRVVILRVSDRQSSINRSGYGRRLEFDIEVAPFHGDGKPVGFFL
ncbi:phage tail protein [Mesorhizobium xinjiangense]|uniref:phage tail protein n=1 Tax=Mesorhizobium xinjiangense TaxID=2678685 RepID=UPI001F1EF9B8|nr:phage tail protein [Mesorhizobium xinjiangense]